MIDAVVVLDGGRCRQCLGFIDRRSWRMESFVARMVALKHRERGWILIDTGYGGRFATGTRRFPFRLYRWVTPVRERGSLAAILAGAGIPITEIRHVVITHFHADHIGGLADLASAEIHYATEALNTLMALRPWAQVRAAFLPALVPAWLPERARPVPLASYRNSSSDDLPFPCHDLWGDGSLLLVSLPGHAPGQVGVRFAWRGRTRLYSADAYWRRCQVEGEVEPFGPAMTLQWAPDAYRETVARLRHVVKAGRVEVSCCHDVSLHFGA